MGVSGRNPPSGARRNRLADVCDPVPVELDREALRLLRREKKVELIPAPAIKTS